jgi:DNA-binding PadR family transcriptional regulator
MAVNGALKLIVIKLLSENEKDGVSIIQDIEFKTGWKVSYGSFYPLMKNLEETGIVQSKKESKSNIYSLTKKGKKLLENIHIKKKEVSEKACESLRLLSVLGGDFTDFVKMIKSNSKKDLLDFIAIHKELINQNEILTKIDISKNKEEINSILKKANNELEKLK